MRVLNFTDATRKGFSLEVIKPGENKARTLVEEMVVGSFYPSPNQEHLAIWCMGGDDNIIVVNRKGEVSAEVRVKAGWSR